LTIQENHPAMKSEIPPAIVEPCPLSWNGMEGGDKQRFCEQCQLHVYNLSEMTARERSKLLASDEKLCVTYLADNNGALIERARTHWLLGFFSRARIALLALIATIIPLGTGCASRQMGKPAPPQDSGTLKSTPTPAPPKLPVPGGISIRPDQDR
jgi:hypothetical protein